MNLKITISVLTFCLLSLINGYGQIKFDFAADEHDFGVIEEGLVASCTLTFTNAGKDTILLSDSNRDVRPGCGCTVAEYSRAPIPPGGKGFVKPSYNSQGRIGAFNKTITVSQKGTPYVILTIKGIVVKKEEKTTTALPKKFAVLSIDKKEHNFGKIKKGTNASVKLVLKNSGKDTLKLKTFQSACNCIQYKILNQKDNSEIKYILPGKAVFLEILYQPQNPGVLSDSKTNDKVIFFTNDLKYPKLEISLSSELAEN